MYPDGVTHFNSVTQCLLNVGKRKNNISVTGVRFVTERLEYA